MDDNLRIHVQKASFRDSYEFLLEDLLPGGVERNDGRVNYCANLIFDTVDRGNLARPSFTVVKKQVQFLMDELWAAGLRPTDNDHTSATIQAKDQHLRDLRAITFKSLNMQYSLTKD